MNTEKMKYKVKASNTTNTYVYCFLTAKQSLEQARKKEDGYLYFCMAAGVFAAFAFEAYLNHIGLNKIKDWVLQEKKLGHKEKLKFLIKRLNININRNIRPFKTLNKIFELRDELAHGKTITKITEKTVKSSKVEQIEFPQVNWKKYCNLSSVEKIVEDVEEMILDINKQLGMTRDPFISPGHGWSEAIGIE